MVEHRKTLRVYLDGLGDVAAEVGNQGADLSDRHLSLYHDALVQRFETALSTIHQLLGEALSDRGYKVRVGSSFTWVIRQSAQVGLISREDRDCLEEWVINRHVTSHRYSPSTINEIVRIVPEFRMCGYRVLDAVSPEE